jgi:hypothetical protein
MHGTLLMTEVLFTGGYTCEQFDGVFENCDMNTVFIGLIALGGYCFNAPISE